MDDPMSVDLRKLKKSAEVRNHPPVHLAPPPPVAPPPPPPATPAVKASVQPVVTPPSAPPRLPPKPKRPWGMPSTKTMTIGAIGAILLIGAGHYIYSNFWTRSPFGPTPESASAAADTASAAAATSAEPTEAEIVAKVAALIVLPEGESPALAKVSDLSALSGQAFFARAKVGDIVLMYPKAARAVLYDPVANKVVEVGPIQNATSTVPTDQ